ncbi:IclR family transcriptional regulator [Actinobaculum suis]|uniref:IclR family transcriptional regulator n=1 Tax=Actinobaculum suis TaxID=1657 RepID=UPI0009E381CF|nr:IclR family transcriptional regulator [Actinobaculum suis]
MSGEEQQARQEPINARALREARSKRREPVKRLSSIDRALTIIEYLAERGPQGESLGEIAAAIEANKATVHHTLSTLKAREWVDQDIVTGNYYLGDGITPLVRYATRTETLLESIRPALRSISIRYNELVHAGILVNDKVRYIDKVEPARAIRVVSYVGREVAAATTALGRALLGEAELTDSEIDWYYERVPSSARTLELRQSFKENLQRVRREGWAYECEENETGIACVSVPLNLPDGSKIAVSVSAPVERLPFGRARKIASGMVEEFEKLPASAHIVLPAALH